MSYYDKKRGKHVGRVKSKQGGLIQSYFDSKQAADEFEEHVRRDGKPPERGASPVVGKTFREVAEECRAAGGPNGAWHSGRDASMQSRLDYVIQFLGDLPIVSVGTDRLNALVADLRRRPVMVGAQGNPSKPRRAPRSPSTINRYMDAASAVLTYAAERSPPYIPSPPKIPRQKPRERPREPVPHDAETTITRWLLEHGHHEVELCVRFLTATGLRRGELDQITPEQIRTDHVRIYGDQSKNDRPRTIYLPTDLAREMRALIAAGRRPVASRVARVFKAAAEACVPGANVTIHSLRHTFVTRSIGAGVPTRIVQDLAGHKSIVTTERYAHVDDDMRREAARKLSTQCVPEGSSGDVVPFNSRAKAS